MGTKACGSMLCVMNVTLGRGWTDFRGKDLPLGRIVGIMMSVWRRRRDWEQWLPKQK